MLLGSANLRLIALLLLCAFGLARIGPACASMVVSAPMLMQDMATGTAADCNHDPKNPANEKVPDHGQQAACGTGCLAAPSGAATGISFARLPERLSHAPVRRLIGWEGGPAPPPPREPVA